MLGCNAFDTFIGGVEQVLTPSYLARLAICDSFFVVLFSFKGNNNFLSHSAQCNVEVHSTIMLK